MVRYIFTVVQRRIPSDAFFTGESHGIMNQSNAWNKLADALNLRNPKREKGDDDESSAGASLNGSDDEELKENSNQEVVLPSTLSNVHISSLNLIDHLSGLFSMINNVCEEQFEIIRKVFPANTVAKVTRQLIQRIFNDPAFGIQARVDSILLPQPPRPALPLADYLDALVTVREKLSALNVMLIEYCSHPAMRGMGSEAAALQKSKRSKSRRRSRRGNLDQHGIVGGNGSVGEGSKTDGIRLSDNGEHVDDDDSEIEEESEEILRSDAEIREFFEEQVFILPNKLFSAF